MNLKLYAICLLMANSLGSCVPLASGVLIAGTPVAEHTQVASIPPSKDGPALMARFKDIRDLDTDSDGNVYVVDENLIRKISPEGQVTTLIGRDTNPDAKPLYPYLIVHGTEIEVIDRNLYFVNLGCLLRFDLTQTASEPRFEEVMGTCISTEEAEQALRDPKFNPNVETRVGTLLSDSLGNLYFGVSQNNKGFDYVLNRQGEKKLLPKFFGARFQAADSKGYFYFDPGLQGSIGPDPERRIIVKYDIEGNPNTPPIPGRNLLESPQIFTMDTQDYLYLIDQDEIKRLSPEGKLQTLAQPKSNQGKKITVFRMAVNAQRTVLYLADGTAVYQVPLPQDPK